jgi:phage FluMu gp28-like protein
MEVNLFKPFKKQKEILDNFLESKHLFGVLSAPRGSGKTLLAENMMLFWLLSNPNQKGGFCSPVYNQAKKVFDEIVQASRDLIVQSNRQDLNISFINGSTLKFLSSDNSDTIRGFRFHYLIIDEFAYHKEQAITMALLPTLNPNGKKCLMVSTPRGKNFFYSWYTKGLNKESDVISFKIPLTECPYINQTLVDEARKSLPPDVFKQEYLAEFTDASSDVFVGIDRVSIIGMFDQSRKVDAFVGVDTGLTSDMSVLTIISPTGRVLWIEATNNENITAIADKFIRVMSAYNIVGGFIEVNGIGRAMADLVLPKYRKVKEFVTTQDSKTEAVRKLIADIESQTVELPTIELCPELHNELSSYTYKLSNNGKLSFSHPNGGNDDYVDSLLLANYSRVKFMDRKPLRITGIRPKFQ